MRKNRRNRGRKPDEYFAAGPIELARFGRHMIGRSRATPEQSKAAQKLMAEKLPAVITDINSLVQDISQMVAHLPAGRLLHRAWWDSASTVIKLEGKDPDGDEMAAINTVEYLQAIVAATAPNAVVAQDVTDQEWRNLTEKISALFQKITLEYQMCLTADLLIKNPDADMALEEFRFRAETLWVNVRGKRYQSHEAIALLELLTPHSDILIQLFGIDATVLVGELEKILNRLTFGLGDALGDLRQLQRETAERIADIFKTGVDDLGEAHEILYQDAEFAGRMRKAMGEFAGLDLYDVKKNTNLPDVLLTELTWSQGEDAEFFAPGDFAGWPLRVWPTMKRPFIQLEGQTLCFSAFALFDNIYRILQRVILRLAPAYRETWKVRQTTVSEQLPLIYLQKLLPGGHFVSPAYYRGIAADGKTQWCEVDGLYMYEDHLFVVEVKGGAFTYTAPATDLPAHIASLNNLILSPASQGGRFLDYLESADEVPLADRDHQEIGALRRSDFRHVTVCAVTLDPFTELAARAQHLRKIGLDIGPRPVWSISLDDLRVYADLFDNPLVFLHFVEHRMNAVKSDKVDLNDELDHAGMYFTENNYSRYAEELSGHGFDRMNFNGYRTPINEFYSAILAGDAAVRPKQEMPERYAEIIEFLATSKVVGRAELVALLLDADGEFRQAIADNISKALVENVELGRPRPLSTYGEMGLTIYVWSPAAPRVPDLALEHVRSVISASSETHRPLIELEYDAEGQGHLMDVHWQVADLRGLSVEALRGYKDAGTRVTQRRILNAQQKGKIGRNDQCPCGSGRKYKRCCNGD